MKVKSANSDQLDIHSYARPTARSSVLTLSLDRTRRLRKKELCHANGTSNAMADGPAGSRYPRLRLRRCRVNGAKNHRCRVKLGKADKILGVPLRSNCRKMPNRSAITFEHAKCVGFAVARCPRNAGLKRISGPPVRGDSRSRRGSVPGNSPGVGLYDATIRSPKGLAVRSMADDRGAKQGGRHQLKMVKRFPSYLIAIAVGDSSQARWEREPEFGLEPRCEQGAEEIAT